MLKLLNIFIIFVFATICHWLALEAFARFDINVGIMAAFTIIVASLMPKFYGYLYGFVSGLFLDFFGTAMFGGYALVFTALVYIFYTLDDKIDFKDIGPQLAIPFGLNIMTVLLYGLVSKIFTGEFIWQGFYSLVLGSVITALLLPVLYQLTVRLFLFDFSKSGDGKTQNLL